MNDKDYKEFLKMFGPTSISTSYIHVDPIKMSKDKTIEEIYNSLNEDQIEIECNRLDELEPALMAMAVFPMVEDLLARIAK
jgi:hypothetical protein